MLHSVITVATCVRDPARVHLFWYPDTISPLPAILGLAFLRVPTFVTIAVAIAVIAVPSYLRHAILRSPCLVVDGPGRRPIPDPTTMCRSSRGSGRCCWGGIAAARWAGRNGLLRKACAWQPGSWSRPARFAGRTAWPSICIHQPVLIGALWLFAFVVPPQARIMPGDFTRACQAECLTVRDEGLLPGLLWLHAGGGRKRRIGARSCGKVDRDSAVTTTLEQLAFSFSGGFRMFDSNRMRPAEMWGRTSLERFFHTRHPPAFPGLPSSYVWRRGPRDSSPVQSWCPCPDQAGFSSRGGGEKFFSFFVFCVRVPELAGGIALIGPVDFCAALQRGGTTVNPNGQASQLVTQRPIRQFAAIPI